jgi:nucleotide-binding universal stress UspA family protein
MYRNVLIATDLSECSEPALHAGIALAHTLGASVIVLYVSQPPYGAGSWFTPMAGIEMDSVLHWTGREEAAAREQLAKSVAHASAGGTIPNGIELRVVSGIAHDVILGEAARLGIDLIVVGTHGRSGFRRALLGSIAERLVRTSPVAVLTVRGAEPLDKGATTSRGTSAHSA